MAISGQDVVFLNRQLDRHLRRQQSWPWVRMVLLCAGLLMAGFGMWLWLAVPDQDDSSQQLRRVMRVTHGAASEPVTRGELLTQLQASDQKSEREARDVMELSEARWACSISAIVNWVMGCYLVAGTLARWNRHRLDAIVIQLLRDKCREELEAAGEHVP